MGFNITVGNSSLLACHVAKHKKINELIKTNGGHKVEYLNRLVGYYGDVSHSHALKAFTLNDIINSRELPYIYNEKVGNYNFDTDLLVETIEKDIQDGLIPFFVFGVLGSTPSGSNDDIEALADICEKYGIYLMIDAAYGGCFFICEEFRHYQRGLERANAYSLNFAKTMITGKFSAIVALDDAEMLRESFLLPSNEPIGNSYVKLGEDTKQSTPILI